MPASTDGPGDRATSEPGTRNRATARGSSMAAVPRPSLTKMSNATTALTPGSGQLLVGAKVVLTPRMTAIVDEMREFFRNAGASALVTSGIRTAEEQLALIRRKAIGFGLDKKYA